ncbi:DUF4430 domain-containing protein [Haloimpatiens massiliensis]|uniref:DUF4430 domain-containing protein n=1 Tax=Haloimpatiens massiliensis TaxID=1658110 RepID=UPI001FA83DCD|nr:DUF4430 domain-containing protein [Haloimpatiens massiliensis]
MKKNTMTKKRLSIVAFVAAVFMCISVTWVRAKVETPDEHAENASKIVQVAEKGKSEVSSVPKESKQDPESKSKPVDKEKEKAEEKSKSEASKAVTSKGTTSKAADSKSASNHKSSKKSKVRPKFKKDDPNKVDRSLVQKPTSGVSTSDSNYARLVAEANKHTDSNKKDKYMTDPTPKGMPTPVEPQDVKIDPSRAHYCILSVRCNTILDNMEDLRKGKECMVPRDGVIYKRRRAVYYEGESVYNVLSREMARNRIHMDFEFTPMYNSVYIKGIHNLYEFDCGPLSGWMYKVNGWFPNYGCSRYLLKPGDNIEWEYTCDLGRDVGCEWIGDK